MTNLDNKTTTVDESNNLVLVISIAPDAIASKVEINYWLTTLFASDKQMSDDSTYHGARM